MAPAPTASPPPPPAAAEPRHGAAHPPPMNGACRPRRCNGHAAGAAAARRRAKPAAAPKPTRRRRRSRCRRSRRRRRLPPTTRRFRRRRQSAALGDGSRAQAAGAGNARPDRRALQEARQACRTPRSKPRWPADELSTGQERRFKKLRNETVDLVKSLKLNNNRIEALVDQMYGINRRLVSLEGRLLRLAEAHGVDARRFPQAAFRQRARSQLGAPRRPPRPASAGRISSPTSATRSSSIATRSRRWRRKCASRSSEFRRIVQTVQKGERESGVRRKRK